MVYNAELWLTPKDSLCNNNDKVLVILFVHINTPYYAIVDMQYLSTEQ